MSIQALSGAFNLNMRQVLAAHPKVVRNCESLRLQLKMVLLALANEVDKYGWGFPTMLSLSADTELGRRSVQRYIKVLVQLGLVRVHRTIREKRGGSGANAYELPREHYPALLELPAGKAPKLQCLKLAEGGVTPVTPRRDDTPDTARGDTSDTARGDTDDTPEGPESPVSGEIVDKLSETPETGCHPCHGGGDTGDTPHNKEASPLPSPRDKGFPASLPRSQDAFEGAGGAAPALGKAGQAGKASEDEAAEKPGRPGKAGKAVSSAGAAPPAPSKTGEPGPPGPRSRIRASEAWDPIAEDIFRQLFGPNWDSIDTKDGRLADDWARMVFRVVGVIRRKGLAPGPVVELAARIRERYRQGKIQSRGAVFQRHVKPLIGETAA